MSENTQKILKRYNIPSSLTDSGIGLQEDEVEPLSNVGSASKGSVGCTSPGDRSSSSRFSSLPTSAPVREGLGSGPDQFFQDGISYEIKEGTPESPSGVERSKLESRAFKRPPPARSQKKRAKGEPPTANEEASPPKLAPPQSPSRSPASTKNNESSVASSPSHSSTNYRNAGTLTELNNNSCAEIELVSLIEEQIPRYKLRADTITDFTGYDNADWINAPLLPLDEPLDLAPELIEETLNYFILCADRLTQMTRTYDDTDALTRLLEEKERDLELAALIGKSLLEEKRALQERIEALEQELQISQEAVTQLRHDLTKKNSLLSIYMEGEEEGLLGEEAPASLDLLHKKINELENENERLKIESQSWTEDLAVEEEKETELINECVRELNEKNKAAAKLQEELARKTESVLKQQEEITQLLGQQVDLQKKLRDYSIENETLRVNLEVMSETQQELTFEISDSKDKYNTLLSAFQELQEALRQRKQRTSTGSVCSIGVGGGPLPAGAAAANPIQQSQSSHSSIQNKNFSQGAYGAYTKYINPDSLAAELSMSLRTDNSEGYHSDDRAQTASTSNSSPRPPSRRPPGSTGANGRRPVSGEFDATSDEGESSFPESYHTDDDSQYSSLSSIGLNPVCGKHPMGLDLGSPMKGMMPQSRSFYDLDEDPTSRCRTPDSILSGFNGFSSGSTTSSMRRYRMPDKLELIKRLEGSRTLHRWRRLATPTPLGLAGLEEETEGIKTRTVPKSPPIISKNSLPKPPSSLDITSFLEEIDRAQESPLTLPGKSFVDSSCIYTYSNSNVLHPDATYTTPSLGPTKMAITAGKTPSPVQTTPSVMNRSSYLATTTCSVNRGLARILNERGIHAMLPSVLRERSEEDEERTATSTPAPSPDQTPPGTPPNEEAADNDELNALMPDLVRENRAKGVVLRAYRVDGKSSPLEPAAARRESLRRTKRGSQELDAQGLVSKLSRLVQWPFQGFVSDGNGNSVRTSDPSVQLTSTVTTTSTLTDTITSVIPIVSSNSTMMSSVTSTRTTSCLSSPSIPSVSAICSTTSFGAAGGKPTAWLPSAGPGLGTGNAPTLTPAMRMPLARAPNPLLQINGGRGRPIGTVSSMRNMRKGALM